MISDDDLILIANGIDSLYRFGRTEEADAIKRVMADAQKGGMRPATVVNVTDGDRKRPIPNRAPPSIQD